MTRYVAFLRAINTPPRHVKMARLREVFSGLGFEAVATHIASGNVVFDAREPVDVAAIEAALLDALGFEVPVFLRTAAEVLSVAGEDVPEGDSTEVAFLERIPDPEAARTVEASVTAPERVWIIGRELYWWHDGPRNESTYSVGRTTRTLGMAATHRAMRTVRDIADRFLR